MASNPVASLICTEISARRPSARTRMREVWEHRELLVFLSWRDVRVRYRQTALGAAWALLEPGLGVVLYTLLFHGLARLDTPGVPYPLYCYVGLLGWTFFARGLRATTLCLVANSGLLTKAYFPRLVLPLAAQLATVVDFACALVAYGVLALYYGAAPGLAALTLPLWIGLAAVHALGVGLALAAVNVRYRDVTQAIPFLIQVWMFATPVAYPYSAIPEAWRAVYALNPMVAVTEGLRWALLPGCPLDLAALVPSLGVGAVLLAFGLACFNRIEHRFADII